MDALGIWGSYAHLNEHIMSNEVSVWGRKEIGKAKTSVST